MNSATPKSRASRAARTRSTSSSSSRLDGRSSSTSGLDIFGVEKPAEQGEKHDDRHHDGARHAPLADRVDREQLAISQIHAEAEAEQGEAETGGSARLAAQRQRAEDQ